MKKIGIGISGFLIRMTCYLVVCLIILMGAGECSNKPQYQQATDATSQIQAVDQNETAINFQRLRNAVPVPQMTDSVERRNLVEKQSRFNVASKISYIYLVSFGKIMAYYTVKGKVSSVNSMLTCTQQLVDDGNGFLNGRSNIHVVDSPDIDGSYGSNGNAIFFFTAEGVYVEWNGEYLLCDQPLNLQQPPELIMAVDSNGKGVIK